MNWINMKESRTSAISQLPVINVKTCPTFNWYQKKRKRHTVVYDLNRMMQWMAEILLKSYITPIHFIFLTKVMEISSLTFQFQPAVWLVGLLVLLSIANAWSGAYQGLFFFWLLTWLLTWCWSSRMLYQSFLLFKLVYHYVFLNNR